MQTLTNVTVGDQYTTDATIQDVISGNGGFASITGADVFVELQYGLFGQTKWTQEFHVPIGGMVIHPGTSGIKFRNFVAGTPATVTVAIAERDEPSIDISATGQSASATSTGAMQLISTQNVPGAPVASLSFNVPIGFQNLVLIGQGRTNIAGTVDGLAVRLNGDSGANYDWQSSDGVPAVFGGTSARIAYIAGATAPANIGSSLELLIPNYLETTFSKTLDGRSRTKTGAGSLVAIFNVGIWRPAVPVAISQITLFPESSSFIAGSIFSLYGETG